MRVRKRAEPAQLHPLLLPDACITPTWPKSKCCSGVFTRQYSTPKKSAERHASAKAPARVSRRERAGDALGAIGRAKRRKHGGQASFPSSSVTHSRQKVPPQCGHLAAASRMG